MKASVSGSQNDYVYTYPEPRAAQPDYPQRTNVPPNMYPQQMIPNAASDPSAIELHLVVDLDVLPNIVVAKDPPKKKKASKKAPRQCSQCESAIATEKFSATEARVPPSSIPEDILRKLRIKYPVAATINSETYVPPVSDFKKDEEIHDVIFETSDGKQIPAFQKDFSKVSPVLKSNFDNCKEKICKVEVDFPAKTVELVIDVIVNGKESVYLADIRSLRDFAEKYSIEYLKAKFGKSYAVFPKQPMIYF